MLYLLAKNHQNQSVTLDALTKRMLALGYVHLTFLLKVRSHLAYSELLHATKMKCDKRAFSFRKINYITNSS